MIVDSLENAERYGRLHPGLAEGFAFLRRSDLAKLPNGRHELRGTQLFAIVSHDPGRGREKSLLESHRKYIDIQYIIEHPDVIGWLPTTRCTRVATPYDADKDIGFFYDRPPTWLEVPSGFFAIFFPADVHAPLATEGPVHKVVVKVAVE